MIFIYDIKTKVYIVKDIYSFDIIYKNNIDNVLLNAINEILYKQNRVRGFLES